MFLERRVVKTREIIFHNLFACCFIQPKQERMYWISKSLDIMDLQEYRRTISDDAELKKKFGDQKMVPPDV